MTATSYPAVRSTRQKKSRKGLLIELLMVLQPICNQFVMPDKTTLRVFIGSFFAASFHCDSHLLIM